MKKFNKKSILMLIVLGFSLQSIQAMQDANQENKMDIVRENASGQKREREEEKEKEIKRTRTEDDGAGLGSDDEDCSLDIEDTSDKPQEIETIEQEEKDAQDSDKQIVIFQPIPTPANSTQTIVPQETTTVNSPRTNMFSVISNFFSRTTSQQTQELQRAIASGFNQQSVLIVQTSQDTIQAINNCLQDGNNRLMEFITPISERQIQLIQGQEIIQATTRATNETTHEIQGSLNKLQDKVAEIQAEQLLTKGNNQIKSISFKVGATTTIIFLIKKHNPIICIILGAGASLATRKISEYAYNHGYLSTIKKIYNTLATTPQRICTQTQNIWKTIIRPIKYIKNRWNDSSIKHMLTRK